MVEGRGLAKGEVGMTSLDLMRPILILSQFSDMQSYSKTMARLAVLQPAEARINQIVLGFIESCKRKTSIYH